MLRFIVYAVPLMVLLLALFGFAVELLDFEPRRGSVIRLALFEQPRVPGQLVVGAWLVESAGLIALFLLTRGRFGHWWLDGLVAGWVGWIFRGPLLVITIVVAARQPQDPWWTLAFGWWALYSACGFSLALLARRSGLDPWAPLPPSELATAEARASGDSGSQNVEPESESSDGETQEASSVRSGPERETDLSDGESAEPSAEVAPAALAESLEAEGSSVPVPSVGNEAESTETMAADREDAAPSEAGEPGDRSVETTSPLPKGEGKPQ